MTRPSRTTPTPSSTRPPAPPRRPVAPAPPAAVLLAGALLLALSPAPAAQVVPADAAPAPPAAGRPAGPIDGPYLVVEPSVLDLGEVYWGQSVEGSLTLTNVGSAPLEIDVTTTCGCTTAPLAARDKRIAPGASLELPVTMTPKGPRPADLVKHLKISTNEPARPMVDVPVGCVVLVGVSAQPEYVLFRELELGDTRTMTLLLESGDGTPFALEDVRFTSDLYRAEYTPGVEGVVHDVVVTTGPIVKRINPSSRVIITTTHPKAPELTLNCNSMVVPAVRASLGSLFFGDVAAGGTARRQMKLWQTADRSPLEQVAVTVVKHPELRIDARRDELDPELWHFTLHVPEGFEGPMISSAIRIEHELGADATLVMMAGAKLTAADAD